MKPHHSYANGFLDDLEEQCQEALFEVCDARERYPRQCADVLKKCIQLKNDIHVMNILNRSILILFNESSLIIIFKLAYQFILTLFHEIDHRVLDDESVSDVETRFRAKRTF